MTMKFLYAKPIDENRCAIVVDMGNGKVVGGVVILTAFNNTYHSTNNLDEAIRNKMEYVGIRNSQINMTWQWSKGVSADDLASGKAKIFDSEFRDSDAEPPMKIVESSATRIREIESKPKKKGKK